MLDAEKLPEFLSTKQIAKMLGTGEQMWKMMRTRPGDGPPFVKVGKDMVRYPTALFVEWLKNRSFEIVRDEDFGRP